MLRLSLATTWHWTQRPDCTSTNLSIGYWQTARIYALLGQAENARRYAQMCFRSQPAAGREAVFWPSLTKPWRGPKRRPERRVSLTAT